MEVLSLGSRLFFSIYMNNNLQKLIMTLDTPKIRKNVDLINAFTGCPMGKTLSDCPFLSYYALNDEDEQIRQIETIPQDVLDKMRAFHLDCVEHYRERRRAERSKVLK